MNSDDQNEQPMEDPLLPASPPAFPPLPLAPADFATGMDQDAGQAVEQGQAPPPPATVNLSKPIPSSETTTYSVDSSPPTVPNIASFANFGNLEDFVTSDDQPEFPPLPERQETIRGQADKQAESPGTPVVNADAYRWLPAVQNAIDRDKEHREEILRAIERMASNIAMLTSMVSIQTSVADDSRARLLALERWAMQFTMPGIRFPGY